MQRLNYASLSECNSDFKPQQPSTAKVGIVHLGFGAFHRAHQAYINDVCMHEKGGDWKIIGVNWGGIDTKSQVTPQDNLYTVAAGMNDEYHTHVISTVEAIYDSTEIAQVQQYLHNPEVKIVSLTITEKGYCHNPATGRLNQDNPMIKHDLENINNPQSAIGFLVEAIKYRKENNIPAFTPLTCDNLPENGHTLSKVVLDFCELLDKDLFEWVKANIKFPCTMVDRIVPRTTPEDVDTVSNRIGVRDEGCVVTESFLQWVIEDSFINDRPQWENTSVANISVVKDVVPYENMKLRLLNGTHSTMAYLGYLSGYKTVSETISDPKFKKVVRHIMDAEVTPSLAKLDVDLDSYKTQLIERYSNTALQHLTWQIAMDGSQKLPQRFLETITYGLQNNINVDCLCLAVSGWIKYVSAVDENGNEIDVRDPLSADLKTIWDNSNSNEEVVGKVLQIKSVFSDYLASNQEFKETIISGLNKLTTDGAKKSVHDIADKI